MKMFLKIVLLLCSLTLINCLDATEKLKENRSYNILGIFYFPSQSHHILGSALLKELARRGHNVTMVSPFPFDKKIPNYTDIKLNGLMEYKEENITKYTQINNQSFISRLKVLYNFVPTLGNIVLSQDSMQNLLKSDSKFDLIILFYPLSDFLLPLSHRFSAPVILFSPIGGNSYINRVTGNVSPYSYVPHLLTSYTDKMTFFQRVMNTLFGIATEFLICAIQIPQHRELTTKYFPDAPTLDELYDNVALTLLNSHFSTETPRPYTPNMIQIGGFHVDDIEPLPKDLKKYLDDAKDGVIYFSFGTNLKMSDLPKDKLQIMIKTFSKLKQKVLWKHEGKLDEVPKNVKIQKWLPQKGILNHPNVKLFVTHGGKGSIVESTKSAVPMLAIPFFGDQPLNVASAVNEKYALSLSLNEITEENFYKAIQELLNNPIYKENIELKSSLLAAQPMKPMDTAIYWINHVIENGGADHLKPASLKLNFFQELCLDVYAALIAIIISVILAIYLLIRGIRKIYRRYKETKKNEKDKVKTS